MSLTASGMTSPGPADAMTSARSGVSDIEEEDILREVCNVNGIKYHRLEQGPVENVKVVEMFFSGFPKIVGMDRFPNLTTLCVMGQDIDRMYGLTHLTRLRELWLCECKIQRIEGLGECKRLEKLYLYSNNISKIENIAHLKHLEKIWLAKNKITVIEGVIGLQYVEEINLAENKIDKIGHSLDTHIRLENLNLSGNKICSFKELTNLVRLPSLRYLGLKDPQYSPNPVCLLCNYSTHMLYHLPTLERLDTYDVSSKNVRELAEATVVKKKMYYNMRVKTIRRNMMELMSMLKKEKNRLCAFPFERIRVLTEMIKATERDRDEVKGNKLHHGEEIVTKDDEESEQHGSGTESDTQEEEKQSLTKKLKKKHQALKERVKSYTGKVEETEKCYGESVARIRQVSDMTVRRLLTELETGGNVRFEDGRSADVWFTSCHDLILSRFCAADYKDYGVLGIKIHRITRVHNRILRFKFDDKLAGYVDKEDLPAMSRCQSVKKLLEYLFFVWDPELPGGKNELMRVLEEGPMDADTYKQLGRDGAVPLSNSLSLCEKPRIESMMREAKNKSLSDPCPFRHGQLVVCKVYLGKSAPALDVKLVHKPIYPRADSIYRPKKHERCTSGSGGSSSPQCECTSRQCEWFVFDHELVLPEYVIDFEYITKLKPRSPFTVLIDGMPDTNDLHKRNEDNDPSLDDDVVNMEPEIKPRPRLIALTEELILKTAKVSAFQGVTVLNLHGNGLTKLKYMSSMTLLRKLIVSFNELTRLDDVAHMNLEYLDASFNKITSLEGMRGMSKLKTLDLSWNDLSYTRDELSILRKHCSGVTTLDLRHNPWQKPDGLRLRTIGRLKSLTKLNGSSVTESEATAALRMAAGSRISQVSLLAHSRTDKTRPRSLSLASYAQILWSTSRNKPDRVGENDSQWYLQVTTLNLDGQHITKISNLDRLENLRWASFNDNDITKIEGLDSCINLEELSLEDNCIGRLEGLSKLGKLRSLNVSNNHISTLEGGGLDKLTDLQYLSVENNRIMSLTGLSRLTALIELYIGNNYIINIREIFHLKNLPNFVILDLYGNPVASEADNYRLFVVYHLKTLKALDGIAIESSEGGTAKDTFGGRLTQDFVAERLGHANFLEVRELDFPTCGIRQVDLGTGEHFLNLRSVNLEHNSLSSFSGLIYLINLRVLCLNHNHIETIVPKPKSTSTKQQKGSSQSTAQSNAQDMYNPENYTPVLENLEVLHLGYNGISDLLKLQISRLPSLKALFLQGNDITKVEGLEGLQDLRELVLDRNKIKNLNEYSFMNQWNLVELHMEENRLRELSNFHHLENLQRLYLGMNRVQDMSELEKLEALPNMIELSVISNPVSRRLMHRPMLVYRQPNLLCIDGIPVSAEERTKAELYFMEQQPVGMLTGMEGGLPGISAFKTTTAAAPLKVTNMQLGTQTSVADRHGWSTSIKYGPEETQITTQPPEPRTRQPQRGSGRGDAYGSSGTSNIRVGYSHFGSSGHSSGGSSSSGRGQYLPHQVPYVPHQPPSSNSADNVYCGHSESLARLTNSNGRKRP
ncbi:leucine-rich repeat-containing protein 9-like isoform X2 [Glandiceps talaboti]